MLLTLRCKRAASRTCTSALKPKFSAFSLWQPTSASSNLADSWAVVSCSCKCSRCLRWRPLRAASRFTRRACSESPHQRLTCKISDPSYYGRPTPSDAQCYAEIHIISGLVTYGIDHSTDPQKQLRQQAATVTAVDRPSATMPYVLSRKDNNDIVKTYVNYNPCQICAAAAPRCCSVGPNQASGRRHIATSSHFSKISRPAGADYMLRND